MAANELKVLLTGDASRLSASLNTASNKLKSFGKNVSSVGSSLSKISLPLALAGGAAIKMGADFDKSLTKIQSLVGVASDEVSKMGEAAKVMAANTGRSANEAAEALFFITSAGLRGSEAMDVLNASLKASAVGLGETKVIADLATSAMNAYGSEVLSATDATDIMVAAVREGKLEADELAGSMGRVIPIASNMGVGFHEIGAAFAGMSRTGTNAAEAATQLRGIFMGLLKPTTDAEAALSEMGLSSTALRKSLKEDGLLATLEILKANFEGNDTASQRVFGNARALTGIMDLLGKGVDSTRQIFDNMNKTQGATADAFEKTSKSASFNLEKSLNELKIAFTELGGELLKTFLPYIKAASKALLNLFRRFQDLSPEVKKAIIILGGIVTILGPALIVIGKLISAFGVLSGAISTAASSKVVGKLIKGIKSLNITMLANPYVAIAAGVIALGTAFVTAANKIAPSLSTWEQLKTAVSGIAAPMSIAGRLAMAEADKIGKAAGKAAAAASGVGQIDSNVGQTPKAKDYGSILTPNATPETKKTPTKNTIKAQLPIPDDLDLLLSQMEDDISGVDNLLSSMGQNLENAFETSQIENFQYTVSNAVDNVKDSYGDLSDGVEEAGKLFGEGNKKILENAKAFNIGLNEIITGGLNDLAVGIGEALGSALAGGGNLVQSLSTVILGTVGNMAVQLGKLAISIGIGVEGIKKALQTLNPAIAIAGGIALIALGSFAKAQAGKIAGGGGGGQTAFAKGGIVSGPVNALVGEYPGAKSNPEVIAPLNKLKNLMGEQGGGGNMNVSGEFVVRGQDLVVALQRADKTRSRIK